MRTIFSNAKLAKSPTDSHSPLVPNLTLATSQYKPKLGIYSLKKTTP